jgi:photosystem II stability/assembly factor-like uncharacterized protein
MENDMKDEVQTRQDLLYLLAQASDLEHSLACQYLYTAFSLKLAGEEGVTATQAQRIDGWRQLILGIAVQEMLHLGLASNLLTAIGGAPYFRRANFPQEHTYSTLGLDFRLAGATESTLRRFCCFELPPEIQPDSKYAHWKDSCAGERHLGAAAVIAPLLPQPIAYHSIGALYALIENGFKTLYPDDASKLFIGPRSAQTTAIWKPMMVVTTRDEALEAIDLILRQGEGAYGHDTEIEQAHFGKLVTIHDALQQHAAGSTPAWPVVENPVLMLHHDIAFDIDGETVRPTILTADIARDANEIFVALYELALQVLLRYFANTDETEEQRYILAQVFLSLMRFGLTPLGTAIARLPAFDGQPAGPRAGASFEFYSDTLLLPHKDSAWRYFEERLTEITAAAQQLAAAGSSADYPLLRRALTGGDTAREPGIAAVCSTYALGVASGRAAPGRWTWDNGIRAFFSPLDIERMAPLGMHLADETSVRNNKEKISQRIGTETLVRMPPQYLLEDDTPGMASYRNPEGPWTDERIAIFRAWAGIGATTPPFVCPENPTWEATVKDWFTATDVDHMRPFGIDLSSYESVKDNIDRISTAIETKRMPPGGWSDEQIACFKEWRDAGMPPGEAPVALTWSPTTAPRARRYDDVFFVTPDIGWAVNSDAKVLHTRDGGRSWTTQTILQDVGNRPIYPRCIQFANETRGFLGTVSAAMRLYTTSNGGQTWEPHADLPAEAPLKVCGLTVVNANVVYATGTNEPGDFSAIMKTVDGGRSWTAKSLEAYASILIDNHFFDEQRGLVVGGYTDVPRARRTRDDVQPVILLTEDGGETWVNLLRDFTSQYPKGEWGWKIFVVNANVIYVSLENFFDGAVAKTEDGGKTWRRLRINDAQGNVNLEGVGFISEDVGWVGGWGDARFQGGFTSATQDGSENWRDANEVGRFINRFRFFGSPVNLGYASGDTIYKYSAEPEPTAETMAALVAAGPTPMLRGSSDPVRVGLPFPIRFIVPSGATRLRLHIWNQFANFVRTLVSEDHPAPGERQVRWDGTDAAGAPVDSGVFIYRLHIDDRTESRVIRVDR